MAVGAAFNKRQQCLRLMPCTLDQNLSPTSPSSATETSCGRAVCGRNSEDNSIPFSEALNFH